MQTNDSISIYRITKDWKGALTSALVGTYDVWLEYGEQYNYKTIDGAVVRNEIGKGLVIMTTELDLSDCYIMFADIRYDCAKPDTFKDRNGNFHHMEFVFK